MRTFYLFMTIFCCQYSFSQDITEKLNTAINKLYADEQFKHGTLSMYVADSKTGKMLFEKNSAVGMAPASCLKVVTSASAFELLGKNYQYKTSLEIYKADSTQLFIDGSGDPTPGSWRWNNTKMDAFYKRIADALKKKNISTLATTIGFKNRDFTYQPIPDGWVWEDIGNYYGAGAWGFNWRENQYSLALSSAATEKGLTQIKSFDPPSAEMPFNNFITTGKPGSGDNAYIFSAPYTETAYAMGTIPPGQNDFVISGSMPNPTNVFCRGLRAYLNANGIKISSNNIFTDKYLSTKSDQFLFEVIDIISSPTLDSMNYWFLKKSLNLYGEAFVKTIAYEKNGIGSTDTGIAIIRDFWAGKGIEKSAIKILDGSGLSPANRITTNALVQVLLYAQKQPWYTSFYNALPEMNGIKMKDGYIGGVRAYTGYIKSSTGAAYTFSFIVNNFDGNPGTAREKMWKVLDLLK